MNVRLDRVKSGPVVVSIGGQNGREAPVAGASTIPPARYMLRPLNEEQAMSLGGNPLDRAGQSPYESHEWMTAQADAERAARSAGYKSLFRRLFERLRPHRQEPGGDPQINHGTSDDPGH
jgi:hypothetical protein